MIEIYTITGGDMWRQALNGVVTILGSSTFSSLMRIAGTFSVLGAVYVLIRGRNPMSLLGWLAVYVLITSVLLVPKRAVQIVDITDRAAVYEVDNVPVGLAVLASTTTGIGYGVMQLFDYSLARPDSLTYSKTGMLFGSEVVAQTSDMQTLNPTLGQMLPDYVQSCVIGDIMLVHKYSVHDLLNSTDPLALITGNPSPLRGLYRDNNGTREFVTCQQAAVDIRKLMNDDTSVGSVTLHSVATRLFGSRVNADTLLAGAMGDSYGFFYKGGLSAAQIMRNNITNSAVRQGWKSFSAGSSDTANLVNLASESSLTKQRLSWAAGGIMALHSLPFMQSAMMLILVCLFPLVIALAASNHSVFGINTLKLYVCGFLYFQMWPVMFAILNFGANFYLQTRTGGTDLVLANADRVALQHSDVSALFGYLSISIPVLSFFLTKGAAAMGSQAIGGVLSSGAFTVGGQASTTADGNWSFNNLATDNLNQNKLDSNLIERAGQQSRQMDGGGMRTQTQDGSTVFDTSGAISNLPVNLRLSQLASSGFSEQSRQAAAQAQTSLDGYNNSVTSGYQQLQQLSRQHGSSDTLTEGSDSGVTASQSHGISQMRSAVEGYSKANHVSEGEAYSVLSNASVDNSLNAGMSIKGDTSKTLWGKPGQWLTGVSGEMHGGLEHKRNLSDQHGTQDSHSDGTDYRQDHNSQFARDFRQGADMVTSTRLSESGSHTDNQSASRVEQFAATLNDAKSQYHQYTDSTTRSQEMSRMATLAQNQSASLDANYNQAFVDWTTAKYGDDAEHILTNVSSAQSAAAEFVHERLEPQIMHNYAARTEQVSTQPLSPSASLPAVGEPRSGTQTSAAEGVSHGVGHTAHSGADREAQAAGDAHNPPAAPGLPSGDMNRDYSAGAARISEEARSDGLVSNVADRVAEQRSGEMETLRRNDEKIAENKTPVQASSDILRHEHAEAQGRFAQGYVTEKGKQHVISDRPDPKEIDNKLNELRRKSGQ